MLGTTTQRATVNGALAECAAAAKRRRFVELLEEVVLDDLAGAAASYFGRGPAGARFRASEPRPPHRPPIGSMSTRTGSPQTRRTS